MFAKMLPDKVHGSNLTIGLYWLLSTDPSSNCNTQAQAACARTSLKSAKNSDHSRNKLTKMMGGLGTHVGPTGKWTHAYYMIMFNSKRTHTLHCYSHYGSKVALYYRWIRLATSCLSLFGDSDRLLIALKRLSLLCWVEPRWTVV